VNKAMSNSEVYTIDGVPFNSRQSTYSQFQAHMERQGPPTRVHLLCSAAYKGSGKTTLLHINMKWFVDATKGIAIHVTFNDDQSSSQGIWKMQAIESRRDFERALAVRILHRLVENNENSNYLIKRQKIDVILSDVIDSFENPIPETLQIVRRVLGVPESTKVLLAVDEIAEAPNDKSILTPAVILSVLVGYMDKDVNLFLAVAAYGAVDVQKLCTGSKRTLLLQCLPPLYFPQGLETKRNKLLPLAIRPFFRESERKWLPFGKKDILLYNKLSKLILATGGHPRRVFMLYDALKPFHQSNNNNASLEINDGPAGLRFVDSLRTWLTHEDRESFILRSIKSGARFPTNFKLLGSNVIDVIEQIAVDTSNAFDMPDSPKIAKVHKYTILGTAEGHCSIVTCVANVGKGKLLAFIPPPVLAVIKAVNLPQELRPCGMALIRLATAIRNFHQPPLTEAKRGKAWEQVLAAALLLYTRSNDGFSPSVFCGKKLCGEVICRTELRGGETVEFWEDVHAFPKDVQSSLMDRKVTADELRELIARIPKTSSGALFIPKYQYNLKSDIVGIFKSDVGDYVVLCIQAKDWFRDEIRTQEGGTTNILDKWREYETFPEPMQVLDKNQNREVTVTPFHLLLTTNALTIETRDLDKSKAPLHAREGMGSIRELVNWLPTAGFACQLGEKLRELFSPVPPSAEEGSSDPDPNRKSY